MVLSEGVGEGANQKQSPASEHASLIKLKHLGGILNLIYLVIQSELYVPKAGTKLLRNNVLN